MKTQKEKNKLAFKKAIVTDLNGNEMSNINGGTSTMTVGTTSLILVTLQNQINQIN